MRAVLSAIIATTLPIASPLFAIADDAHTVLIDLECNTAHSADSLRLVIDTTSKIVTETYLGGPICEDGVIGFLISSGNHSHFCSGIVQYKDGVSTRHDGNGILGLSTDYVLITDEYVKYGTIFDNYPQGLDEWRRVIDRRTGILRHGSLPWNCTLRAGIPKKF